MPRRAKRFTIYDVMEENGVFDTNPANSYARDADGGSLFAGPVEYPKMLYHPEGKTRVTVPAEEIMTPFGPKRVGEKTEIIHRIVNNEDEENELVAEGWHKSPNRAQAKATGKPVELTPMEQIEDLKRQLAEKNKELAELG